MSYDYRCCVAALDARLPALEASQIRDPSHPDAGGFAGPDGLANPSGVSAAALYGYAYLLPASAHHGQARLVEAIEAAAAWARRRRTPAGRFDLLITNFDSAPDTAFTVQALAPVVRAARRVAAGDEGAQRIATALGELIRTAAPGMVTGGFHTPNHRWVLVSALALAGELFPDLASQVMPTVEAYLAEGIDVNADGEFIERSTTVYNPVCDRALRLAAESLVRPELLAPVRANLELSYHLMHADATVITSISGRQDRGARAVPAGLADTCYWLARRDGDGTLASLADWLVARGGPTLPWVLEPFLTHPDWASGDPVARRPLATSYRRFLPAARLWRCRRGRTSATLAEGLEAPFHLRHGDAELAAVRIHSTYFATGRFAGRDLQPVDGDAGARLHHAGANPIYPEKAYDRPVYWLPVGDGTRVDAGNWVEVRRRRPTFELPPMAIDLQVREVGTTAVDRPDPPVEGWSTGAAFELRVSTSGGPAGVPFQVELLFTPGGSIEVAGALLEAHAGTTAFLTGGEAVYRVGADEIRVGPGARAHATWHMRGSPEAPDHFRLLVALLTPVDHVLSLKTRRAAA